MRAACQSYPLYLQTLFSRQQKLTLHPLSPSLFFFFILIISFKAQKLFTQPAGLQLANPTFSKQTFSNWTASILQRLRGNWVSIASQKNNHGRGLRACGWGDECVGAGLNNLVDKIHVYFLDRAPSLCSWETNCSFIPRHRQAGSSWWPWVLRLKRIRNDRHSLGARALATAPGSTSHWHGFCPCPRWDSPFLYSQWKVIFDHLVRAC